MKKETLAKVKVIFKLLGFLAAIFAAHLVSGVLIALLLTDLHTETVTVPEITTPVFMTLQALLAFILSFSVIYIFQKKIDKESIVSMGLTGEEYVKDTYIGQLWGVVCIVVGFACIVGLDFSNVNIELQPFRTNYLLAAFVSLALAAFMEEMIFRGYLLRKLLGVFNKYTAILISAVVFSLLHLTNPNYDVFSFINIFIVSILFALMYIYTNSLWLVSAFHFSWNCTLAFLGFTVSGVDFPGILNLKFTEQNLFNGGEFGFESSYICTIIVLLSALLAVAYRKKLQRGN